MTERDKLRKFIDSLIDRRRWTILYFLIKFNCCKIVNSKVINTFIGKLTFKVLGSHNFVFERIKLNLDLILTIQCYIKK